MGHRISLPTFPEDHLQGGECFAPFPATQGCLKLEAHDIPRLKSGDLLLNSFWFDVEYASLRKI